MADAKLKIGLVLDTSLDPVDGVQRYVIDMGEWLRRQGHDAHYLVGQTERKDLPNIHSLARNIGVMFNGNRTTIPLPTSRRKLHRFLRDHKFDVLHVQTPHSPFMSHKLILSADKRTAVIGTFHILPYGPLAAIGNRLLGVWLRRSLKRFDYAVSVSEAAAHFAELTFKIETGVLPNVIEYDHFHKAKPLSKYDNKHLNILFLGRLVPRKGCQLLLEAVSQLKNEDLPAFRVIICGKGPLEAQLKQYVQQNNLDGLVKFTGFVSEEDKPRYYASADISVFPSSGGESFGIVLLEAMACGKAAVLAGDNPGYSSVMSPKPELLFDPNSSAELAEKLKLYLTDEARRRQIAEWGAQYAVDFDVNLVGQELLKIYNQALRNRAQL